MNAGRRSSPVSAAHPDLQAVRSDLHQTRTRFVDTVKSLARALRPKVLIADDNLPYGKLLLAALAQRGIDADLARDEGEVRMLLARSHYDLVVVDGTVDPAAVNGVPAIYVSGAGAEGARVDVSKSVGIEGIADEVAARVR